MFKRNTEMPEFARPGGQVDDGSSTNIKMLLCASAVLCVTIGLILIIPDDDAPEPPQLAVTPEAPVVEAEVSRSDASLLSFDSLPASEAVSRQLRQPIRLTDSDANRSDLRMMTALVLADFGHAPHHDDPLLRLLVQALSEGQSNAYIDALLNTAAARGDFTPPRQLVMTTGRMDTETLLVALVRQVQGQT